MPSMVLRAVASRPRPSIVFDVRRFDVVDAVKLFRRRAAKHLVETPPEKDRHPANRQQHDDPPGHRHIASFCSGVRASAEGVPARIVLSHLLPASEVMSPKNTRNSSTRPILDRATGL